MTARRWPALLIAALAACTTPQDPKPALIVSTSAAALGGGFRDVTIEIASGYSVLFSRTYPVDEVTDNSTLSVFLQGASGDDPKPGTLFPGTVISTGSSLLVTITASGDQRLTREALVSLPASDVKLLSLPLQAACVGLACPAGTTCSQGQCVDLAIDSGELPQATDYLP